MLAQQNMASGSRLLAERREERRTASGTRDLPRRLRRLTAAVARRLIGDARMVRAIGKAGQRLAAAEEEFRTRGVANRPMTGGIAQFKQRQSLVDWHDIVVGDRIGVELDLE